MNDFDKIFENAVLLELIKVDNDGEKEASRSLYNYLFNEWLRKNFINELTEENYSVLCTEEKFNEFLKALNEEENKNKKENISVLILLKHFQLVTI